MQRKDWGKYELLMNKFTLLNTNILTENSGTKQGGKLSPCLPS